MFILDTDVLSATHYRIPPPDLIAWFDSLPSSEITTTAITISEIQTGIELMRSSGHENVAAVEKWLHQSVLATVRVIPMGSEAAILLAKMYSHPQIRRMMQPGKGAKKVLPGADAMICAIAISEGAAIATRNVRHFLQVHRHFPLPGLYNPIGGVWHVPRNGQGRLPL